MPAIFKSQDPSYQGPERRLCERRGGSDRRESIRLDAAERERRQVFSRRGKDQDVWQDFRPD